MLSPPLLSFMLLSVRLLSFCPPLSRSLLFGLAPRALLLVLFILGDPDDALVLLGGAPPPYLSRNESGGLEPSLSLTSIMRFCIICGVGGFRRRFERLLDASFVGSLNVTNANPLLLPEFLSRMMATSTTDPY